MVAGATDLDQPPRFWILQAFTTQQKTFIWPLPTSLRRSVMAQPRHSFIRSFNLHTVGQLLSFTHVDVL